MCKQNLHEAMLIISNINNDLLVLGFELDSSLNPFIEESLENISKNISLLREAIKKEQNNV